jgi:hypothetical protein
MIFGGFSERTHLSNLNVAFLGGHSWLRVATGNESNDSNQPGGASTRVDVEAVDHFR